MLVMDAAVASHYWRNHMSRFDLMNKENLRAACKAAGIAYGKLNNDGMRAALAAKDGGLDTSIVNKLATQAPAQTEEVKSEPAQAPQHVESFKDAVPAEFREAMDGTAGDAVANQLEVADAVAAAAAAKPGLKIEKNRAEQNGITRPSTGGVCAGIWTMLDDLGTSVTLKQAKGFAAARRFDKVTLTVQFYRWRKFNGIQGRQVAKKV
jgi:hypothetical protein